ncbi:MAG: SulP family inorganic anion transporter, partial [Gemmatimonadales bacterium]
PATLAIVVIGYSESVSVAQGFAEEHKYEIRPNRELGALGASAAASGLFQGFISGGGASQSAANDRAGARTQAAGLVLAVLAALTSIALMPLFKDLPIAALAAIVISAVVGFLDVRALRRLRALRGESFLFAILALLGVVFLGILPGLLIAAGLSVLLVVGRLSRPVVPVLGRVPETDVFARVDRYPDAEVEPGVLVVRPDAPLLFFNATWVRDEVRGLVEQHKAGLRAVILDLELSADLDVTGADALAKMDSYLRERGVGLALANLHAGVRTMLERTEAAEGGRRTPAYLSVEEAVAAQRVGDSGETR